MALIEETRNNPNLPKVRMHQNIKFSDNIAEISQVGIILLAVPAQTLRHVASSYAAQITGKTLVACCKGIDLENLVGPLAILEDAVLDAEVAILTGPSFAADIAVGLPTALTLARATKDEALQEALSTSTLRLYRTTDTVGAELGGALKNVIAIGAGVTIGAGLGDSARASLMTRGFSEMQQLAECLGARPETLNGLSGFGDLVLTCTSKLSRNFCYGLALGAGQAPDATKTVEGVATAKAVGLLAKKHGLDLPICSVVSAICNDTITVQDAVGLLMNRPLKEET
jgi:glycerol-3-phosphate dehydrogenase (NAD(P)+)